MTPPAAPADPPEGGVSGRAGYHALGRPEFAGQRTGPSDPGMAGERTMLAWSRLGMSLLSLPTALFAFTAARDVIASAASVVAAVLGLVLLTLSLRRQRVSPGIVAAGRGAPLATMQVLVTSGCVLMLAVASLVLVLS